MLDFRIITFLTVCQTMNYTRAAEKLNITQPAVSQHIRAIEEQYDVKLFRYEGKQLYLTEAGRFFLQTANAINHDVMHLQSQLKQISSRQTLHFGATLSIGEYLMPGPLSRLLKTHPDIRLNMVVENTDVLLKMLNQGEIDFAIIEGFFPRQSYEGLRYKTERFIPVCAPHYSFKRAITTLDDLLPEHLLVRETGSGTREMLERSLWSHNLTLGNFSSYSEIGSLGAIKSMVMAGAGISFFYESVVQAEIQTGHLAMIPIPDFHAAHDFTFIWQKGSIFTDYYRQVFSWLKTGDDKDSSAK